MLRLIMSQPLRSFCSSLPPIPTSTKWLPPLSPWRMFLIPWARPATVWPTAASRSECDQLPLQPLDLPQVLEEDHGAPFAVPLHENAA